MRHAPPAWITGAPGASGGKKTWLVLQALDRQGAGGREVERCARRSARGLGGGAEGEWAPSEASTGPLCFMSPRGRRETANVRIASLEDENLRS